MLLPPWYSQGDSGRVRLNNSPRVAGGKSPGLTPVFSLTGELFYHSSEHFIEVTGCGSSYMPCARPRAPSLMSLCMHIDAQRQFH